MSLNKTIPLPGEHGFHIRDGSLMRKKKEQWAKEKAEAEKLWFPFGYKREQQARNSNFNAGGRPSLPTNLSSTQNLFAPQQPLSQISMSVNNNDSSNSNIFSAEQQNPPNFLPTTSASDVFVGENGHFVAPTKMPAQPMFLPANSSFLPNPTPIPMQYFYANSSISSGGITMPPSSMAPTPIFLSSASNGGNMMMNADAGLYFSQSPAFLNEPQFQQLQNVQTPVPPPPLQTIHPVNNNAPSPAPSTLATTTFMLNSANGSFASNFENSCPENTHSFIGQESEHQQQRHLRIQKDSQKLLNEQIEERKRLDAALEEQERLEMERLAKIHRAQQEKQVQESEEEKNKWKKREETLKVNEKTYLSSIEQAKLESEALRKAKLFKHILLSADVTQEQAMKILGTDDPNLVANVLKQLGALERQKRLDLENLNATTTNNTTTTSPAMNKLPNTSTMPNNSTRNSSPNSTNSKFQRANSISKERKNVDSCNRRPINANITMPSCSKNSTNTNVKEQATNLLTRQAPGRSSLRLLSTQNKRNPLPNNSSSKMTPLKGRSDSLEKLSTNSNEKGNSIQKMNANNNRTTGTLNSRTTGTPNSNHSKAELSQENNNLPLNLQVDLEAAKTPPAESIKHSKIAPVPPPRRRSKPENPQKSNWTNQMSTEFLNYSTKNFTENDKKSNFVDFERIASPISNQWDIPPPLNLYTPQPILQHNRSPCQMASNTSSAMHFLAEIPNQNEPLKLTQRRNDYLNNGKTIGLFEPVSIRQRTTMVRHSNPANSKLSQNFYQEEIEPQHHRQLPMLNSRNGNSAGASSIATTDSSSPISVSPPLSAGYKSSTSPFEQMPDLEVSRKNSEIERILSDGAAQNYHEQHEGGCSFSPRLQSKFQALLITPSGSKDDLANGNFLNNGALAGKPPASPFARKLAEGQQQSLNNNTNLNSSNRKLDYLAPEQLRRTLRSPTLMRLQDSLNGYAGGVGGRLSNAPSMNALEGDLENNNNAMDIADSRSRPITPKPFNCRSSQYRSLNLKKDTDRQQRILEQLARVRAELKDRRAQIERCVSNQNLANN